MSCGLVDHLRGYGNNLAVLTNTQQLSYRQLADAVTDTAQQLGGPDAWCCSKPTTT
jgi:hypothetical protein